jgi:putative DNA primase/helicase
VQIKPSNILLALSTHERHDIARAVDALYSIPPDLPRHEWVRAGMAAQAAGLDLAAFDAWSAQAGNYRTSNARDTWRSFKPGKGVGAGTLFGMARDHGWSDGAPRHNDADLSGLLRQAAARGTTKPQEPPRKPAPGMSPAEVWARSEPATNQNHYVVKKHAAGVPLDLLRVLPAGDPLRIGGASMAGALVVPAYAHDGTLPSLQLIPPEGKKMNLSGVPMAGASFTVGIIAPDLPIYVVEGIGQAWACWQATGHPAVVCFGAGNMRRIAEGLRQRDASGRLVLVPDVGKEADADNIAGDIGAAVARMPEGEPNNFDASDLAMREGLDALAQLLESAHAPPKPEPLLKPVSVFDVLSNPSEPPQFVWAGYLPRGTVSLLGAHGGTGKSTIALMLGVCAALGRPLFGVDTVACKTLFVSLEDGQHIIRHRLAHICRTWAIDPEQLRDRLHIVDGTANPELFAAESRGAGEVTLSYLELCKLVLAEGIGLVVVDNASDAFGGDEIQRRQVRAFMRALATVARLTDCAVILLAHVDKNTSRNKKAEGGEGYSGSTAWHNSARSRLFMTRAEDGTLTLEHQKSNLGKLREPLTLTWPDGGLPMLAGEAPDVSGLVNLLQGRADDDRAIALLKLIAEFETLEQYSSPAPQARNNVFAMLRSEPGFQRLKLRPDDTKRIVTQCQRAKWLEPLDYRSADRKPRQRWTVTADGRAFAGLPAPTAPTAPTCHNGAEGAQSSMGGAPTAPTYAGGVGDRARTQDGAEGGAGGVNDE